MRCQGIDLRAPFFHSMPTNIVPSANSFRLINHLTPTSPQEEFTFGVIPGDFNISQPLRQLP
jgi:hypothetical protein